MLKKEELNNIEDSLKIIESDSYNYKEKKDSFSFLRDYFQYPDLFEINYLEKVLKRLIEQYEHENNFYFRGKIVNLIIKILARDFVNVRNGKSKEMEEPNLTILLKYLENDNLVNRGIISVITLTLNKKYMPILEKYKNHSDENVRKDILQALEYLKN